MFGMFDEEIKKWYRIIKEIFNKEKRYFVSDKIFNLLNVFFLDILNKVNNLK